MKEPRYEIIQYTDGGPNDKGRVIDYVRASSKNEAKMKAGIVNNGFCDARLISDEVYYERLRKAKREFGNLKKIQ